MHVPPLQCLVDEARVIVRKRPWILPVVGLLVAVNILYEVNLWSMVDLAVYRAGGSDITHSASLYDKVAGLPFTYPPFAAVAFVPLSMLGTVSAEVIVTLVSLVSYAGFVVILGRRLGLGRHLTALVMIAGLAFEPVLHTIGLGQVNLILGLGIATDCLVLGPRHRGFLVGVAIGVKLTPAVFLLYFALRRDVRAMLRSTAGLAVTIAIGWAADPRDSSLYWGHLFYSPNHVGRVTYPFNQSIFGVLARLGHTNTPSTWVYAVLSTAVLVVTIIGCRRMVKVGQDAAGLTVVAVGGLLVSPISWTHHWIWLLPASVVLLTAGRPLAAAIVCLVSVADPLRYIPTPKTLSGLHLTWWQTGVSLTYTMVGLGFLLIMAFARQPSVAVEPSS